MTSPPNPFEAPQADAAVAPTYTGELDLGAALSLSWKAMSQNVGPWILVTLIGSILGFLSGMLVVGIFLVWPILFYGLANFSLKALDGEAKIDDFMAGFSRYGALIGPMLGLGFLYFLIVLPGAGPSWTVSFMKIRAGELGLGTGIAEVLAQLWSLAWGILVVIRFYFAPYLVVERNLGAIEALKASWELTKPQLGMVIVWYFVTIAISLAGVLACLIGSIPAAWIVSCFFAAGYRQLTGQTGQMGQSPA